MGIHLSATDVFYVKKRKNTRAQTSEDEIADYGADGDNDDNSEVSKNDDTDYEVLDNECDSEEDKCGISGDETDDFMGDDFWPMRDVL
jgi:hypothetical protein